MNDKQKIKQLLIGLAEAFRETLSEQRMNLYCELLSVTSAADVELAIRLLLRDPTITRFPMPALILEKINPTVSADDAANEMVARVLTAVERFGYVDPDGAKEYLGEIVWQALPGRAGWMDICFSGDPQLGLPKGTARAQLRDRISAKVRRENPSGRIAIGPPGTPAFKTLIPFDRDQLPKEEQRRELLQDQLDHIKKETPDKPDAPMPDGPRPLRAILHPGGVTVRVHETEERV